MSGAASNANEPTATPVAVIGAGSFGTALAIQLARRGSQTRLWGRNAIEMADADRIRHNPRYLADCEFPMTLVATGDLDAALRDVEDIVIATPSHALRATVEMLKPRLVAGQGLVIACKGFEPGSGKLSHEVVADVLDVSHPYAVLSIPTPCCLARRSPMNWGAACQRRSSLRRKMMSSPNAWRIG